MSEDLLDELYRRVKPPAEPKEEFSMPPEPRAPPPEGKAEAAATPEGEVAEGTAAETGTGPPAVDTDPAAGAGLAADADPATEADSVAAGAGFDWLEPRPEGLTLDDERVARDRADRAPEEERGAQEGKRGARGGEGSEGHRETGAETSADGGAEAGETLDEARVTYLGVPSLPFLTRLWRRREGEAVPFQMLREGIPAGLFYIVVIMIVLGVLGVPPAVAAAVAGYFGGRRAGDPVRAVIAALLPFLVLVALFSMVYQGWLPALFGSDVLTPHDLAVEMRAWLDYTPGEPGVWGPLSQLPDSASTVFLMAVIFALLGGLAEGQMRQQVEKAVRGLKPQ